MKLISFSEYRTFSVDLLAACITFKCSKSDRFSDIYRYASQHQMIYSFILICSHTNPSAIFQAAVHSNHSVRCPTYLVNTVYISWALMTSCLLWRLCIGDHLFIIVTKRKCIYQWCYRTWKAITTTAFNKFIHICCNFNVQNAKANLLGWWCLALYLSILSEIGEVLKFLADFRQSRKNCNTLCVHEEQYICTDWSL